MTVEELYRITKQLMFEKPSSTIYDNYLFGNLNRLLEELYEENNMARIFKEKMTFTEPLKVSEMSDEITYEEEYTNNVLPLGLASSFLIDDDLQKYSIFYTKYNNARVINQKIVSKEKIDAFTTRTSV